MRTISLVRLDHPRLSSRAELPAGPLVYLGTCLARSSIVASGGGGGTADLTALHVARHPESPPRGGQSCNGEFWEVAGRIAIHGHGCALQDVDVDAA